jgi:hypothetical protein
VGRPPMSKALIEYFRNEGKKGAEKFTPEERSARAKKAAKARWNKKRKVGTQ